MQKRYNHAGKQIIADDFIKTRGGGSSASLMKVQTIIGDANNSKQINELSDKLKYITSDGIITGQEKKALLREHSSLYSAYLNIGEQMKDAGYTVNDNNLYNELVAKNNALKAIIDNIENTEGDYEIKPTDNIEARFTECWQAVNNCEYFLSQDKNFASRYTLQVDSLTTELDGPVSFNANIYEGNVIQTDIEFNKDEEFTWTRKQEGFSKRTGKKLILYPSDIAGTESKFYCQWKHKMNTSDGTTPLYTTFVEPFTVRIAGIVEYVWSTRSENLNMDAETWTRGHVPAKPATPPEYYLWQRTSKDNGDTWVLSRSNAQPAPEDSDLRSFEIAGALRDFRRSSRGYVYDDQSLTFSIVKRNLSGTPTWSIEPENSNLVLTDNNDGTATVTVKRGYEFGFFKIKAKLSDSDVTRTLLIDSVKPAPKRYNFGLIRTSVNDKSLLPSNTVNSPQYPSTGQYPFIVPNEGFIAKYDFLSWRRPSIETGEIADEVMFFNGDVWLDIDYMPEELQGDTAIDSLPHMLNEENIPIEGKFMKLKCNSLIANYIASNRIDARQYHVLDEGCIYAGGYNNNGANEKNNPGFYLDSKGISRFNIGPNSDFSISDVDGQIFRANTNFAGTKTLEISKIKLWEASLLKDAIGKGSNDFVINEATGSLVRYSDSFGGRLPYFLSYDSPKTYSAETPVGYEFTTPVPMKVRARFMKHSAFGYGQAIAHLFEDGKEIFTGKLVDSHPTFYSFTAKPNSKYRMTATDSTYEDEFHLDIFTDYYTGGITIASSVEKFNGGFVVREPVFYGKRYQTIHVKVKDFDSDANRIYTSIDASTLNENDRFQCIDGASITVGIHTYIPNFIYKQNGRIYFVEDSGIRDVAYFELSDTEGFQTSDSLYPASGSVTYITGKKGLETGSLIPIGKDKLVGSPTLPYFNGFFEDFTIGQTIMSVEHVHPDYPDISCTLGCTDLPNGLILLWGKYRNKGDTSVHIDWNIPSPKPVNKSLACVYSNSGYGFNTNLSVLFSGSFNINIQGSRAIDWIALAI